MNARLAITGAGVIAPGAVGLGAFRQLLASGTTAIAPVDRFDTAGLSSHLAALVRDFHPREFIAPMKLRRMNGLSRLAVAAARLAIDDAGPLNGLCGVALGTAFGPVQTSIDFMDEYVEKGPALASPQLFAESVANAPASHIAIEWKCEGPNVTVTQRESSALAAAMIGASQLLKGSAQTMLIGGVDEANEMLFSVLDRLGALAGDDVARPFDRRRSGMVAGEGSALLVVTGAAADAYGYFSGFGMARDTTAPLSDWGEGADAAARAMQHAIDDAGLERRDIDAIYASANGSVRGDRLEYRAIRMLFGDATPPVVATKGYFGEYAAAGALQLLAALIALDDGILHVSCGFEEPEPEMRLDVVRSARQASLRHILVNSLSAGGGIISAVLSRESDD